MNHIWPRKKFKLRSLTLSSKACVSLLMISIQKASLVWSSTKGIMVDCSNGVPSHVQPWLFSLQNSQHVAKNLKTLTQQQAALDAGFSLFSGDFAFHPHRAQKSADVSARARLLKLLNLVSRDADVKELEALFKQDASLSFMLFKIVSSAAFAQTVKVTSFVQAINLLGRRQLQRWFTAPFICPSRWSWKCAESFAFKSGVPCECDGSILSSAWR